MGRNREVCQKYVGHKLFRGKQRGWQHCTSCLGFLHTRSLKNTSYSVICCFIKWTPSESKVCVCTRLFPGSCSSLYSHWHGSSEVARRLLVSIPWSSKKKKKRKRCFCNYFPSPPPHHYFRDPPMSLSISACPSRARLWYSCCGAIEMQNRELQGLRSCFLLLCCLFTSCTFPYLSLSSASGLHSGSRTFLSSSLAPLFFWVVPLCLSRDCFIHSILFYFCAVDWLLFWDWF